MSHQNQNSKLVKITEASKILGVHKDTLRRWEKTGKITVIRNADNIRLYDLDQLKNISSQPVLKSSPITKISSPIETTSSDSSIVKIAEAAKILNVSKMTLRRWEMDGKIKVSRNEKGERIYDINALKNVSGKPNISKKLPEIIIPVTAPTVKIAEAAKILNVSKMTLRRWEKAGKIPVTKKRSGTRLYRVEDLKHLAFEKAPPPSTEELLREAPTHPPKKVILPSVAPVYPPQIPQVQIQQEQSDQIKSQYNLLGHKINLQRSFTLLGGFLVFIMLVSAGIFTYPQRAQLLSLFEAKPTSLKQTITQVMTTSSKEPDSAVLAATTGNVTYKVNANEHITGSLTVDKTINGINVVSNDTGIVLTDPVTGRSLTVGGTGNVSITQSFNGTTAASIPGLNLTSTSNQIVMGTAPNTGTLTWTPTGTQTITFPNSTGTVVLADATQTLTNKTMSGSSNTFTSIPNSALSNASITVTAGTGLSGGGAVSLGGSITLNSAGGGVTSISNTDGSLTISPTSGDAIASLNLAHSNTWTTNQTFSGNVGIGGSLTVSGSFIGPSTGTSGYWSRAGTTLSTLNTGDALSLTGPVTIAPNSGPATTLTLRSAPSGTANILDVTNAAATTTFFSIDSTGQLSASAFKITDQNNAIVGTAIPGGWTLGAFTYTYRRPVSITAAGDLPINFEVNVNINNATTANRIFSTTEQVTPWRDFRMAYTTDGVNFTEIRRNITTYTSTNIVYSFQLQAQINSGITSSTNYYIYYSSPNLSSMTQTAADLTYIGNIDLDSTDFESTTGWTSGDGAYPLTTATSPPPQAGSFSLKEIAMVDRMGSISTTGQGQIGTALTDSSVILNNFGASTYVYVTGGNTGAADSSVIYKSAISSNNLSAFATTTNQLPQTMSGHAMATATALDTGTGTTTLDLSLGSGAGGCTGTGFSWNAGTSTCTIDVSTSQQTFNFTNINVPVGTILTINGPYTSANSTRYIPIIKATGTVTVAGTINAPGLGYAGGTTTHRTGYGPGGGGSGTFSGAGGGYGGTGGAGTGNGTAGPTYTDQEVGSGGGFAGGGLVNGGAGGGGIEIDSLGDMNINIINANGSNGGNNSNGGGGGGSGGRITLRSFGQITITGSVTANGGDGGQAQSGSGCDGGGGGGGRVTLQDIDGIITGATANGGTSRPLGCDLPSSPRVGQAGPVIQSIVPAIFYAIGGKNGGTYLSTVYKATFDNTTGDVSTVFSTTSQAQLPDFPLAEHTAYSKLVNGVNYIYVLGGNNGTADVSTVYRSTVDASGNAGTFATTSQGQLPQILSKHAQTNITIGGTTYLYVLGGQNTGVAQSTVYKSTLDPATGNLGAFATTSQGQLPVALYDLSAATATVGSANYIFVLGGSTGSNVSTVYRATIDSSGNIGTFSTTGQTQLPAVALSGHQTVTNTVSGTTYFYTIGGTTGSAVSTVYKSTTTSDMTNFYIYKEISATGYDLSNKNDITFSFYSGDNTAALMQAAFSDVVSPTVTTDTDWQTTTFGATSINTWESKTWDIRAIPTASRNSVKWIRFKVNTARTTEFTTYLDNMQFLTSVGVGGSASSTTNPAVLGSANLTLNSQGTGIVRVNYSDSSNANTNYLAGTGGFVVYDGSQDCSDGVNAVSCPLFTVGPTGNITATGTISGLKGISSSGNVGFSGNLGIGDSAAILPIAPLDVRNYNTGTGLHMFVGSSAGHFSILDNGNVGIGTTSPGGALIVMSGNVGIGVSSPDRKLQLAEDLSITPTLASLMGTNGTQFAITGSTAANLPDKLAFAIDTTNHFGIIQAGTTTSAYNLALNPAGGNVGIGTTSPDRPLQIASDINPAGSLSSLLGGGGTQLSITGSTGSNITDKLVLGIDSTDHFGIIQAGNSSSGLAYTLSINPGGGNVGIGTSSPTGLFQVQGTGNMPVILAAATGNVGIGTSVLSNPLTVGINGSTGNGAYLSAGGSWTNGSSREFKENFSALDDKDILNKINRLNISEWNYKSEDPSIKHIGPVAEDFYSIFGVGNDSQHISTIDPAGIALAGIKALIAEQASMSAQLASQTQTMSKLSLDSDGTLIIPKIKTGALLLDESIATASALQVTPSQLADLPAEPASNQPDSKPLNLAEKIIDLEKRIGLLEAATPSASIAAQPKAVPELNLTPPDTLLNASASATLASIDTRSEATFSGQLMAYDLSISNSLKSLGKTTLADTSIAGNLTINGTLSIENGNEINAMGKLYLQKSLLADGLDIFNGKVLIDSKGNFVAQTITASVVTTDKLVIGESLGSGKIPAAADRVSINTKDVLKSSKVFLTVTTQTDKILAVVNIKDGTSFDVIPSSPAPYEIDFNWWIVQPKQ